MTESYKKKFQNPSSAQKYQSDIIDTSYGKLLLEVEKQFLVDFINRIQNRENISYLDFACGTGRILAHVEGMVGTARGIDVSQSMLALAKERVGKADLVCADISDPNSSTEGKYDLITAFRFFLNAEPALRTSIMHALAARLRDEKSKLVFNIHGSLPSHKVLNWFVGRVAPRPRRECSGANFLTRRGVKRLLASAGLELEEIYGYDMLSGKALRIMPYRNLKSLEDFCAGSLVANALGGHQIYVARPSARN